MLQKVLLLTTKAFLITTAPSLTPGREFSFKLCATTTASINIFGLVKAERCTNLGFGAATHSLSGTPHWCLQDYMEVTHNDTTYNVPSGCSLWVKEADDTPMEDIDVVDKTGMKKLSEVSSQIQPIPNGNLVTKVCRPREEGLNSGSHSLRGLDYWCRQEMILLPFAGESPFHSGCSCYVQEYFLR